MPGGRRTHEYPHGKPLTLVALDATAVLVGVAWLAVFTFGWWARLVVIAAFLLVGVLRSRVIRNYESDGTAVPIPRAKGVSFGGKLPAALRVLRVSFFVSIALMLLFGFAPMQKRTAEIGIIACVLTLFAGGFLHALIERHYVNTGRAIDIFPETKL